jgi:hypothetical protein
MEGDGLLKSQGSSSLWLQMFTYATAQYICLLGHLLISYGKISLAEVYQPSVKSVAETTRIGAHDECLQCGDHEQVIGLAP